MLKALILIAAATVAFCVALIASIVSVNAWGVISGGFDYPLQMEVLRWAFGILGGSTTVLTLGGIVEIRKAEAEKMALEQEQFDRESIETIPPGKVCVDVHEIPRIMESAEIVTVAAEELQAEEKKELRAKEHLDNLYPSWDGEISLIEGDTP